jgi:hypothetical protein
MAGKISIECPECSAKLSLSDSSKLGKKIKCPKCGDIFVAQSADDDDELFDDDEPEEKAEKSSSRRRSSASGKDSGRSKKKGPVKGKGSSEGSSLPLIIGGVVGLLVLVGGGLFLSGVFNSKPAPVPMNNAPMQMAGPAPQLNAPIAPQALPEMTATEKALGLRWMPPETDFIIHAKLAEIWQAPLLKDPLNNPMVTQGLEDFKKNLGILPSEIESITIGFRDFAASVSKQAAFASQFGGPGLGMSPPGFGGPPSSGPIPSGPVSSGPIPSGPGGPLAMGSASGPPATTSSGEPHFVAVIKSKSALDLKQIAEQAAHTTLKEANGKSYFEVPATATGPANGAWLAGPTTMIIATTAELMVTMERGETNLPRNEFRSLEHTPQLVIAGMIPAKRPTMPGSNGPMNPAMPDLIKNVDEYAVQLASLGLSVKGGFDLQISTLSASDDGAKKLKAELDKQLGQLRPMFDNIKATAPPLLAELGEMLLTNLKVEDKGSSVKVSTSIPDSAQAKLEQLPPILMMMAMTGGMTGGLGGPKGALAGLDASPGGLSVTESSVESTSKSSGNDSPLGPNQFDPDDAQTFDVASVDGLPDGVTLSIKVARQPIPAAWTADGKEVDAIMIAAEANGDALNTICGTTWMTSKTASLEGGGSLKRPKYTLPGGVDAQKTFLPFDVESKVFVTKSLHAPVFFETPSGGSSKIATLEGSFKYLTFEESNQLTINNVPQKAKRPLSDPEFKAAGIKLVRSQKDVVPESFKLECGKDYFLGRANAAWDNWEGASMPETEKGVTIQRLYAARPVDGKQPDVKFPSEFEMSFKVYSGIKEHTVNFRAENLTLPPPKATTQPAQPSP